MGRTDARAGIGTPGFQSLLRLVGEGGCWVKLSGAHRLSTRAPDYPDARPFHEALVRANPERLIWGTDWPHPRIEGEMPDAGHLLDLFNDWTPDEARGGKSWSTTRRGSTGFRGSSVCTTVVAGLDPAIHRLANRMDARVIVRVEPEDRRPRMTPRGRSPQNRSCRISSASPWR